MVLHETDLTVSTKFCTNEGEICALTFPVILNLIHIMYKAKLHILKMINNGIFPEVSGKVLITYWEQHFWPGLDQDWDRGTKTNANWICCELSPDFLPKF